MAAGDGPSRTCSPSWPAPAPRFASAPRSTAPWSKPRRPTWSFSRPAPSGRTAAPPRPCPGIARDDDIAVVGSAVGSVDAASRLLGLDTAIELARTEPARLGHSVLIADDTGSYAPLGLAEALAGAGTEVRYLTARGEIGTEPAFHLELPHLLPRLTAAGVGLATHRAVARLDGTGVEVLDLRGGAPELLADVDTVVLALRRRSRDRLAAELADAAPAVRTIGDALAPRPTAAAIEEAERVALAI